jgi:glucose-6-phosphate isomerase
VPLCGPDRPRRETARRGGRGKKENFTDILLLGMGGSSLCPDVLKATFGKIAGFPELHVLDSTDPAQVGLTCT